MANCRWRAASTTSSRSIRCCTFDFGISTPCFSLSPRARQMSKKPSIFSLTPPMACISPHWLTEPVTASDCLIGSSDSADSSA